MNIIEEDKYTRTYAEPSECLGAKIATSLIDKKIKWLSIFLVFQSIGMACLVIYGFSDKKNRDAQADRIDKKVHYMISVTPETRAERPYSDFMYDPSVITVIKDVKELVNKTSTSH